MGVETFPLPVRWRASASAPCWVRDAPLPFGGLVVARAGRRVLGLDRSNGELEWQAELPSDAGDGQMLLRAGDGAITDYRRKRDGGTSLACVDPSGHVRWRADSLGTVARGGAVVGGEVVHVVSGASGGPYELASIGLDGQERGRHRLPHGGATVVLAGRRLIIGVPIPGNGQPGLYALALDGSDARPLDLTDTWLLHNDGDDVLRIGGRHGEEYTLELRDGTGSEVRWSVPCRNQVAAIDHDVVVHTENAGDSGVPVLRQRSSGEVRWRGTKLAKPAVACSLAGPLVVLRHEWGVALYRRDDGTLVGDGMGLGYGFAALADGNDLLYGCDEHVLCADLTQLERFASF